MINGLPPVSSKRNIWLARPTPARPRLLRDPAGQLGGHHRGGLHRDQLAAVPRRPRLRQGRLLDHLDNTLAKVLTPVERLLGATLLGTATVQSFRFNNNGNNNNGF